MYPLLQSLEELKLIDFRTEDRRNVYRLTDKGRHALNEVAEAREQMRRSIERSSQVFEKVFGTGCTARPSRSPRFGRACSPRRPQALWQAYRTLHNAKELDERVWQEVVSLLDRVIELLEA